MPAAAEWLARGDDAEARGPTEAAGEWTAEMAAAHAGRTALQVAAAEGNARVLELLLQNGACVDAEDLKGKTALRVAVEAAAEVRQHCARVCACPCVRPNTAVQRGASDAASGAAQGIVSQLLTRGANISHADHLNQTPLQVASELGHDGLMESMLAYKLAQDEKLLAQVPTD